MERDPLVSILDMIQACERAGGFVQGITTEEFLSDEKTRYAVWSQIVILGEAVGRIPETWLSNYPTVPWSKITGMRHRLVHGYDLIDWYLVWEVAENELPPLLQQLREIMKDIGES